MSYLFQISRGPWRTTAATLLWFAGLAPHLPCPAGAHDLFKTYVQHGVHLSVGAKHVDLMVDLTFFEQWSAKERLTMDADGNGQISRSEVDAYVKTVAARISHQVKLRLAGRELALAPLYEPEIDLLGNDKVGPAHHRLRLFFFTVTPATLQPGDEFVVDDALWLKARAIGTSHAEAEEGAAFEAKPVGDFTLASKQSDEARRFTFRCLKPPPAKPNAPSQRQKEPVQ